MFEKPVVVQLNKQIPTFYELSESLLCSQMLVIEPWMHISVPLLIEYEDKSLKFKFNVKLCNDCHFIVYAENSDRLTGKYLA
jgi:hypothetical protein